MQQKEFGLLIKAMRRETARLYGEKWTQTELARRANATPKIISNLERGKKAHLEPELLLGLARAFDLTTRERTAFFSCASGLRRDDIPRPGHPADDFLASLLDVLRQYTLPAFIVDDYDNIIAANGIILQLFSAVQPLIEEAPDTPGGYNVMRLVFSTRSPFAQSITENRERHLLQTVYFFRFVTLERRATRFYDDMMTAFFTEPEMADFRRVYLQSFQQEEDYFFEDGLSALNLPNHPPLRFFAPPQQTVATPYGRLHLIAYLPADLST
ncbi:MAG: XRE family transcriptional regulator, partial [Anaerolineae bacterium]